MKPFRFQKFEIQQSKNVFRVGTDGVLLGALCDVSNAEKVLVISCAGAGKTRTLTERAKYLLLNGVKPSELILITYTNNAAQEMKDRLSDCPGFDKVSIGTIHSYAAQLLSMNKIGLDDITTNKSITTYDSLFPYSRCHESLSIACSHIDHVRSNTKSVSLQKITIP